MIQNNKKFGIEYKVENFIFFFGNKFSNYPSLQSEYTNLVFSRMRQTHSDILLTGQDSNFQKDYSSLEEGDAQWNLKKNLALGISTADCIPLLVADLSSGITLAIHAGWRGLENRIIAKSLLKLVSLESNPLDLRSSLFFIGPHIQLPSFEIEESVANKILQSVGLSVLSAQNLIQQTHNNKDNQDKKILLDLNQICTLQIKEFQVSDDQIFSVNIDTKSDENFHSFRRDRQNAGRQISFVTSL